MICNLHTHTTFCDGKSTPEEVVVSALEKGFSAIGFSGHGYTEFDLSYCMKDIEGYNAEIKRLKEKYKKSIQIYLGIEEDMWQYVKREDYDYLIGSCHYIKKGEKYFSVDESVEDTKKYLSEFNENPLLMAESYYENFCSYILKRKPDIIGHFDILTKFDECNNSEPYFLNNKEYHKIAEKYLYEAIKSGSFFEVNTGAISRGYRKTPYPYENLLYILKKTDTKIMLSSDSHSSDNIDFYFNETRELLCDIGFRYTYILYNNEFTKVKL